MNLALVLARLERFFGTTLGRRLGLGLAALLIVLLAYLVGRHDGAKAVRAADARQAAAAASRNASATTTADAQRPKDVATTTKLQEDLSHADDATPDSRPSAARVALACERLRQQGSRLPAACGPGR